MPDVHDDNNLPQPLSNAVEALCNVLYLIEQHVDEPDSIRTLLKLAEPSVETIKRAANRSLPEPQPDSTVSFPIGRWHGSATRDLRNIFILTVEDTQYGEALFSHHRP